MRAIDLEIDLLRCFVAVADRGGFTAAADAIGRTQSAVSVKIRKLEDLLGLKVFERTSRSLALTPDGEILLGYARRLLDLNDEAVQRLIGPDASGTLRLGIADYIAPRSLPVLLSRFNRNFPRIHVEVRTGLGMDMLPMLERGELDLVICGREPAQSMGRLLYREPLVWVIGESSPTPPGPAVAMAALPYYCSHRRAAAESLARAGMHQDIIYTSTSVAGVQAAVIAGLGVGVLPQSAVMPGMRILGEAEGFPSLPEAEMAVVGEDRLTGTAGAAFVSFWEETLVPLIRQEGAESAPRPLAHA